MTYLSNDTVTIQKPRKCWGCLKRIPIGTQMRRCVAKCDGVLVTSYTCTDCDDLCDRICKEDRYFAEEGLEQGWRVDWEREARA